MMERFSSNARNAGFTLCSAMVAALLAGCSGQPHLASTGDQMVADAPAEGEVAAIADKALAKAEARVARSPRNASARSDLAQLYLAAGRFESAATTFEDSISLGDTNPRTGLSLALSYIGSGRSEQALSVLLQWRDQIPGSDFGLAIALAGQPAQGVAVLTDTLRGGENTAKVRQNLAYAYALDGRWAESRVIAGQDVPADQLEARMNEWASRSNPDQAQARVAGLLGTRVRPDQGQPAALALNGIERAPRFAQADEPPVLAPDAELPAIDPEANFTQIERAEAASPQVPMLAAAPVVPAQAVAQASSLTQKPAGGTIERAYGKPGRPEQLRAKTGSHVVQLGSFRTREGAQRAWGIFQKTNPALRDRTLRITEAEVNGRQYFRVAAVGFDRGSAQTMCSTVKQRGGACLAVADGRQRASASPTAGSHLLARR